jgi:hypothetical protein
MTASLEGSAWQIVGAAASAVAIFDQPPRGPQSGGRHHGTAAAPGALDAVASYRGNQTGAPPAVARHRLRWSCIPGTSVDFA